MLNISYMEMPSCGWRLILKQILLVSLNLSLIITDYCLYDPVSLASSWQSLKEHLLKRFGGLLNAKRLIEDSMQQKDFETLQEYMYRVKVNVQEMTVDDCKSTQTLQVQDT